MALDATAAHAVVLAGSVGDWLLDEGIVEPNPNRDALWQPSEWMPGPHWIKAVAELGSGDDSWFNRGGLANRGVDLITERHVHDPGGNFESPPCPNCRTRVGMDVYVELSQVWLDGAEPVLVCAHCHSGHLIGDWGWQFGIAVGNFAVRFNNWPILDDAFVDEIGQRLSGRWTLILGQY